MTRPSNGAAGPSRGVHPLLLGYLTTEYPKVSHTFIRREIVELERLGHRVMRLAIRDSGGAVADAADAREAAQTYHCLSQPAWRLVADALRIALERPVRWGRASAIALAMSRASDRGFLRHVAYLVEAGSLLRVVERAGVEHLHVHFGTNAAAVARLIRCLGGPTYSMTIHGPDEFDAVHGFSLSAKMADAAFVIAISDYGAGQLRRWSAPEHWNKIHVVRCSVGEQFFAEATPVPADSKTLVCVGRLSAQKGQILLVDAVGRLASEGVDVRLVLAGDGEMRAVIERRITELGLASQVTITGWVDEAQVRQHLRSARALVLPSFAEGLPVVIMEALAMGRPIISTMVAGIPELVRNGESGWLVPAGNVDTLVDAMRAAMTAAPERLDFMGAAGRERVRQRHLTASETARLAALFEHYVGGRT